MKKKIIIGICFLAIVLFNIIANLNTGSSDANLASLVSMATANAEEYGNGKDGECNDTGCPFNLIEVYCFTEPNSYCVPTGCTSGWCD